MTRPPGISQQPGQPLTIIACGALAADIREICKRRDWDIDLRTLSALLHDHPDRIAPEVERLARDLQGTGHAVALAYADCGTYGALDRVCESLGLERLAGLHCYDVIAGPERVRSLFEDEPGTYLLTDFLVRSFRRTVVAELGLDRHPELVKDYFGNYRRIVWLTGDLQAASLDEEATAIAELLGLPLERVDVGTSGLERELEILIGSRRTTLAQ
ncbi:MAG: DUF1638 domain-containing protein [Acidimicrobiales bacterium]